MPVSNNEVAQIFNKVAALLEIEGENPFKIRAYRNAAITIENLPHNASMMVEKNEDLTELPGIGRDLADKIKNIVKTGELELLAELENKFPPGLSKLMDVPGLGPKKVKKLYDALNVQNLDDLAKAADEKKIRSLPDFSVKTEEHIAGEVKKIKNEYNRIKLSVADQYTLPLVEYLKKDKNIKNIDILSSFFIFKSIMRHFMTPVACRITYT